MRIGCARRMFGRFRFLRHAGKALAMAAGIVSALADPGEAQTGFCTKTANTLFDACSASVTDDSLVKKAICVNVSDPAKREQCKTDLAAEQQEAQQLCADQRDGRLAACGLLGEARYDPPFDPSLFDDPRNPTKPNPYFPLAVGNVWEFATAGESSTVRVLNRTKLMPGGVECIVVRDLVSKEDGDFEATDDWYAPAKDGATWYCGEEVKNYESFEGDDPVKPELVSIDGSFKAGRNGDKAGIIFLASPKKNKVYLEEFSLRNAEDVTEVLAVKYSFGGNPTLDAMVPAALANRFCGAADCVVTKNYSLLEPGVFARKYYAKGIGVFLEVEVQEGKAIQLTNCNFDARCVGLPQP